MVQHECSNAAKIEEVRAQVKFTNELKVHSAKKVKMYFIFNLFLFLFKSIDTNMLQLLYFYF